MAETSASVEIPASADRVWQLIGGFHALPDWLPYIPESTPSEGGRVRTLKNPEGGLIVERLQTFSEAERSYSYTITQGPFPARDYLSTLRVRDVPGKAAAIVEWSGSFKPVGVSDDEVIRIFHDIYTYGLAALKEAFKA